MEIVNIGDIVFQVIVLVLIILFFLSLTLFIRKLLISQRKRTEINTKVEQKLDKIIELLEESRSNK